MPCELLRFPKLIAGLHFSTKAGKISSDCNKNVPIRCQDRTRVKKKKKWKIDYTNTRIYVNKLNKYISQRGSKGLGSSCHSNNTRVTVEVSWETEGKKTQMLARERHSTQAVKKSLSTLSPSHSLPFPSIPEPQLKRIFKRQGTHEKAMRATPLCLNGTDLWHVYYHLLILLFARDIYWRGYTRLRRAFL